MLDLYQAWLDTISYLLPPRLRSKHLNQEEQIRAWMHLQGPRLKNLWDTFSHDRYLSSKHHLLNTLPQTLAYLCGFHLPNTFRLRSALERAMKKEWFAGIFERFSHIEVIDIGAGTGAMSHAFQHFYSELFPDKHASYHLIDRSRLALKTAKHLLSCSSGNFCQIKCSCQRIEALKSSHLMEKLSSRNGGLKVFLFGYVLGELDINPLARAQKQHLFHYITRTSPSLLFLLDSANKLSAKKMMDLREKCSQHGMEIIYPCPHSHLCPLVAPNRDWCYSEFSWKKPPLQAAIDHQMGVSRKYLAGSTYILMNRQLASLLAPRKIPTKSQRILVGTPYEPEQQTYQALICTQNGIVRQKTDRRKKLRGENVRSLR